MKIISIGRVRQKFVLDGEAEFLKRLKSMVRLEYQEIDTDRYSALSVPELLRKEAETFLGQIEKGQYLIVLDSGGKSFSSEKLAGHLAETMNRGRSSIVFAIGGASGWDRSVIKKADLVLSLSALTFPHQMVRLLLTEQIYRAFTIIRGVPYHK